MFDKWVAPLLDLPEKVVEETFMSRLKPWIQAKMDFYEPKGLAQMMRIAQKVESREDIHREANLPGYSEGRVTNSYGGAKSNMSANASSGEGKGGTRWPMRTITLQRSTTEGVRKEGPTRRLSDAEFQSRREKGLCFLCNEKYSHDHKCKAKEQRELRMIMVTKEGEEFNIEEGGGNEQSELNTIEVVEESHAVVELSINSVVGLSNPRTMKVNGWLQGKEVIILVDRGATHNLISEKLVKELQLNTKDTSNYAVILGSGTTIKGKGVCEAVELMIGDWRVIDEFLPLELGGVDVILGMQWLYSLGITEVLTMEESISVILKKFEDVFEWPETLPPLNME